MLATLKHYFTLRHTSLLALFITLIQSYKIWMPNDIVPQFPVLSVFELSGTGMYILYSLMLGLTLASFLTDKKIFHFAVLFILMIAVLTDFNKAQAYFFTFGTVIFLDVLSRKGEEQFLMTIALAGIYIWAGIQKLNIFYFDSFSGFIESYSPKWLVWPFIWMMYATPFIEIILAVGFILPKFRKWAHIGAIVLHLGVIGFLLFVQYDYIIIPWSGAMVLYHLYIVIQKAPGEYTGLNWKSSMVGFAFVVFPLINVFTPYFSYLSWNLYSYRIPYGVIHYNASERGTVPDRLKPYATHYPKSSELDLIYLSLDQSGVIINPEPWIYKRWLQNLCKEKPDGSQGPFLILHQYHFKKHWIEAYACKK